MVSAHRLPPAMNFNLIIIIILIKLINIIVLFLNFN